MAGVGGGGGALAFFLGAFRKATVVGSRWKGVGGSRLVLRRLSTFLEEFVVVWFGLVGCLMEHEGGRFVV